MTSWKPQVLVEGQWSGNGQVFATVEEARGSAQSLMQRWTLVRDWRAVETNDPVNYRRVDGRDELVPEVDDNDDETLAARDAAEMAE